MFAGDYCGGMGPAGWLLMIGFWAAVIAVIVWAVTRLFPTASSGDRSPGVPHQRQDTQELLDQRLASGEIDPQTYIAARRELTGTGQR
jgi:putative membrane protein